MTIESVDAGGKTKKKAGMGDPREADAEADEKPGQPGSLAELEASRGHQPGSSTPVDGTSAHQLRPVKGVLPFGTMTCGNPMGYGTCGGRIDHSDPGGRCERCGIPTRTAIHENMAQVSVTPDGDPAREGEANGLVSLDRQSHAIMSALEKEGARLALARQLGHAFWIDYGIDPESWEFGDFCKTPKGRAAMAKLTEIVTEAYKRSGLLPRAAA